VLRRFGESWAKIPRAYLERCLKLVESSFSERLGAVQLPVLVVAGSRDPIHSELTDAVIASFPGAHLETLDCGAEIPMEMPGELARLIERFVAELP
jgi:pimeloyl-ACP methyl ester carboxylesterase